MTPLISAGHRLQLNEIPFGPPPSVRAALSHALASANRYPEFLPERLPRLIAGRLGCAPDRIVVGAGATGVIMHIVQEFGSGDAEVVMATPTFDGFPILTGMAGGRPVAVPLTGTGRQDLAALAAAVTERTRLVVVCSPHNPTGTLVPPAEFESFLWEIPAAVPVVLDEAYVDFVPEADRVDIFDLLDRHPNLLVLRTFSKAYGLSALRVGYAVGAPELIERIARWQLPFGMTALAEVAVRACYEAEAEIRARITVLGEHRDRLTFGLRELGLCVPDSYANFSYLTLPGPDADRVATALAGADIHVKAYPTGIRITVGDRVATDAVLDAVRSTVQ
ncbi:pyridoxal phosphate-dependent aminotransferase [Nocardia seriolae]|uniref:pyridoxal phosphate-dependent aminotransferase n=1 Tax=Nocardia seriolae TaxID=37332 RepID=UPI00051A63F0|nr:aminotransferase class I/II-fold pyridoxal phosphate-dependent enzyme [Nocardia seriolae]WKY51325.1 aminotransferase class I/II-fold pyridoxal phosphate-dependent enzyme [Nocardia seriolae]BEK90690.1 aminotransferase class I/II-fold pyridoxal phosphate-dependent enzyme [Nocardia seriolae]